MDKQLTGNTSLSHIKKFTQQYAIVLILALAVGLRLFNINWDEKHALHPDERMLMMVTTPLSAENLNPNFFNYGHLPVYILKSASTLAATIFGDSYTQYPNILLVGRVISALFDTGTVFLIYLIGKRLWGKRAGLIAGLLYATAVFPIQNSHFYIVDPQLTFWITLGIYIITKSYLKPSWRAFYLLGLVTGLAAATKFTGILTAFLFVIYLVNTFVLLSKIRPINYTQLALKIGFYITIFVAVAVTVFFLTQPYVLFEFNKFKTDIALQLKMNSDPTIFPYTIQFVNTTPYWFPLKEIVNWGLGLPLGLISVAGVLLVSAQAVRKRIVPILMMLIFAATFFAILGRSAVKYTRYYLPLYPILTLCAGVLLTKIIQRTGSYKLPLRIGFYAGLILSLGLWPVMFLNIYTHPNPRIVATDWINQNLPPSATILTEHWDDVVPLSNQKQFNIEQLEVYNYESDIKWMKIDRQLQSADYLVISSRRVYMSIQNYPERYPYTAEFYRLLFAGETDYQLIQKFTNYPRINIGPLKFEITDDEAPESFTIFDHPTVWVFEKVIK